ncbi:MAG: PadR family transcriptional regulator [Brevundimonas subvibrioides]|uniref:PadR family transcriptional regulator n=1 Tax=Brevundimonas subvibrioides TaxID=74313 RepID=A0A258HIS8_9CAUL|nr:helix-turn-helix transcriptional regulator [Brevundimonas subvibrioides]OYX56816.1 MAG: PadR family transcriptional regulator [Brevundimonas subvibrioides]
MNRSRSLSTAARSVLSLLAEAGPGWSHGYDLCRRAGVKSGTLYPLLIRLEQQEHLEAKWLPPEPGRPPRHVYRLTATGRRLALDNPPLVSERSMPIERPA